MICIRRYIDKTFPEKFFDKRGLAWVQWEFKPFLTFKIWLISKSYQCFPIIWFCIIAQYESQKKNLIHWDPAVGNYKLRNFVSTSSNAFKNIISYSLTVPLKLPFFWRCFHLILSCRCHSGVCVIYHMNWLIELSYAWVQFFEGQLILTQG